MISNLLKVIFRFFLRSRFFTILNITGFSIGLSSCIIIYLYVQHELSFDRFHKDGDRIYRVIRQSQVNGVPYNIGITSAPFAEALTQDYSNHIQTVTRALPFSSLIQYQDLSFIEERLMLADKNFFQFFSYPLSVGDAASVLSTPNGIVISEAFARKYFGNSDPVGQSLRMDDEYDLVVTGVLAPLPGNSHLQFDAVGSLELISAEEWLHEWWNNSLNTYVQVNTDASVNFLQSAFPSFMDKYFGADFARIGNRIGLSLEPLQEIYFNYATRFETNVAHGDRRYVYIFSSIGFIIILLATINYINLATTQATERAREVGIRKTLGSQRATIALQFMGESSILCFIAALIALAVTQVSVPLLNSNLNLAIPSIADMPRLWLFLIPLIAVLSLLSGVYPAFILSSFTPVKVLKGIVKGNVEFLIIRKGLITFQFTISAAMIIVSIFIGRQLRFMQEADLGFQKDQVLLVALNNEEIRQRQQSLITMLERSPMVASVSSSSGSPGGYHDATTVAVEGLENGLRMRTLFSDENYVQSLGLTMAQGRFFSKEYPSDSLTSVVLNETAVKALGWSNEEAIGKRVRMTMFDSLFRNVVGVVKDFHFVSMKQSIEPLIISFRNRNNNLVIKIASSNPSQAATNVESVWSTFNTGYPIEMRFLDDVLQRMYRSEHSQGRIFTILSVISIVIASLGIFGLASYMAVQRRKEIGIRKILGGTAIQIGVLLIRDLLLLVVIAVIIAIPVCYYGLQKWSESFAYRTEISVDIFIAGFLSVISIAFIIVAYNAAKTIMESPVKSLRSE